MFLRPRCPVLRTWYCVLFAAELLSGKASLLSPATVEAGQVWLIVGVGAYERLFAW